MVRRNGLIWPKPWEQVLNLLGRAGKGGKMRIPGID
jgi:hypothetical protein